MHPSEQLVGEKRHILGIVAGSEEGSSGGANSFQVLGQLLHHVLGGLIGVVEGFFGGRPNELLAVGRDQFCQRRSKGAMLSTRYNLISHELLDRRCSQLPFHQLLNFLSF